MSTTPHPDATLLRAIADGKQMLGKFVQISCRIPEYDWCELTAHVVLSVEKNCKTVDEAVDFVSGGNGNE